MSPQHIEVALHAALSGQQALSDPLYEAVLADFEAKLQISLNQDADDALLCMMANNGEVAMMLIHWDGSVHRNQHALVQLQRIWRGDFADHVQKLLPIFSEQISQEQLGVAGIQWVPVDVP